MHLTIKTNFPEVQRTIDALGKQVRYAAAVAMTRTAQDVKSALQREMSRAFDRPTRFTLNSLFLKPATKEKLEAQVFIKDSNRPKHYLHPEIDGGNRPQKRFEELLRQRGLLGQGERTVPGGGARLDAFGNMGRGQIVSILSQLQAFNLAGASQNATGSKRSRARRAKVKYFYARQRESRVGAGAWKGGEKVQHLSTGIYAKTAIGIQPVLIFVKAADYKKRLRFYETGEQVVKQNFEGHFNREYAKALATVRWSK